MYKKNKPQSKKKKKIKFFFLNIFKWNKITKE